MKFQKIDSRALHSQRGFTLMEMLIVVILIGVIASIAVPLVTSSVTVKGTATTINAVADKIAKSVSLAQQTLRVPVSSLNSTQPTSSVFGGQMILDVIIKGESLITDATKKRDYLRSGMRPLADAVEIRGATQNEYYIEGFRILRLENCATQKVCVVMENITTDVLEAMYTDRVGGAFAAATAVSTGPVQYTAETGGVHATVKLVYNL